MRVAILGCGPAGLMAAAAMWQYNEVTSLTILSKDARPSRLYGAQYLHAPIPGYTDEDDYVLVDYKLLGSADDYRRKVYGPDWDGTVSPEDLEESHKAWDIRETYERLWDDYGGSVVQTEIDPAGARWLSEGSTNFGKFDLVISSIPAPALCKEGHQFKAINIRAAGDAPDLGVEIPYTQANDNQVLCNGNDHPSWYRLSNIFGHRTAEWPDDLIPPISHSQVVKPLKTNCDCWPDIHRVGRYGKWEKGVLTHHAYENVREIVASQL